VKFHRACALFHGCASCAFFGLGLLGWGAFTAALLVIHALRGESLRRIEE